MNSSKANILAVVIGLLVVTDGTIAASAPLDRANAKVAAAEPQNIDLVDLILDMKKMKGRRVSVRGDALMFSGVLMLSKSGTASERIYISIEETSRDDQKSIIERCGTAFCSVEVVGVVGDVVRSKVFHNQGIRAEKITVAK